MSLLDRVAQMAEGVVKTKLSGPGRTVAEIAGNLYRQSKNSPIATGGRFNAGKVDPLQAMRSRPDPLLGIDWYCNMPDLPGTPSFLPWDRVEEATLPMLEFEPTSNYRAGKMYHYPSHQNLGPLTLKLYEDVNATATAYIHNWQSLIFDKTTGLYGTPNQYKKVITFTLFDVSKLDALQIIYSGCWPQNPDAFNLTGSSSERINPSVTFSVDDITMGFIKLTSEQFVSSMQIGSSAPNLQKFFPPMFPSIFG